MSSIVSTQHPLYEKMQSQWVKCRATVAGQKAVHDAGELFLPKLKDQEQNDYNSYKLRASFFNATWRTVSALSGMLFRKPPEIDVAPSVETLLEDVTMDGKSLYIFAQQVALEVLTSGRLGVLVDYPQQDMAGMTLADAAKLNLRPTMAMYKAETIINWKTARIGNKNKLVLVVLTEDFSLAENQYEHKTEIHYRVLDLFNGLCRIRVFRINDKKEDEQIEKDLFPLMNGKWLEAIPFIFIGIDDTTPEIDEPPLIDLVDINLCHYRVCADYFDGIHYTGRPTAVIAGYTPENPGDKLYIGSASAWVFPDPQTKATFLEYSGQGLGPVEKCLDRLEQQMAILGARLLSAEKKAVETAQTAQIHRAGESSILASIAQTISIGLTDALIIFSEWAGVEPDDETGIELNREFLPQGIDPQALTALVGAWQMGAISLQTLFENLQAGEIISSDVTYEEEQSRILEGAPAPPPAPVIVKKNEGGIE